MARRAIAPILPYLRRVFAGGDSSFSDPHLLESFVVRRDGGAFAALLRRHGPMVLAVCRRLLHDDGDVEDAFQATFFVLVRKAGSLRQPARLANWLYGVAYRTALKARGRTHRQRQREQPIVDVPVEGGVAQLVWRELRPILDEELHRLPEKYRAPVVLCCLEGLSKREAARRLNWPEGTLSTRLHLARHLLRQRLVRRGLTLSAGVVAAGLSQAAAPAAVPSVLTAATLRIAVVLATGSEGAVIPPRTAALMEGVLQAMSLIKWKVAAVTLLAVSLLVVGVGSVAMHAPAAPPQAAEESQRAEAPERATPEPKKLTLDADVVQILWCPDGQLLASVGSRTEKRKDGTDEIDVFTTVKLWDTGTGKEVVSLGEIKNGGLVGIGFSPDGKTLALSSRGTIADGDKIDLWDARTGELKNTIEMDYGRGPPKFAFSPDGKVLAVLYAGDKGRDLKEKGIQGGVRLFEVASGKVIQSMRGHTSLAVSVAFSADGKVVATGGDQHDQTVRLWDVRTGKVLSSSNAGGIVLGVTFSPDGKTVATAQGDGRVLLWDVLTGEEIRALAPACAKNSLPFFSPDGRFLVCAGANDKDDRHIPEVKLWDVGTGKLLRTWSDARTTAGFAPKGNVVAVLGKGGVVYLWEFEKQATPPAEKPAAADASFGRLVDELLKRKKTDEQVVEALFVATLGRFPTESETKVGLAPLARKERPRREGVEDLLFALTNTKEYFAHLDAQAGADVRKKW